MSVRQAQRLRKKATDAEKRLWSRLPVLRFHNNGIVDNLDGVLNRIIYAADPERSLRAQGAIENQGAKNSGLISPHLNPLPKGEERRRRGCVGAESVKFAASTNQLG
jgi:hypothetical protein